MNTLPSDVKLYDIALDLNLNDLRHLCLTNRNMRNICNDDNFWHQKTIRDFGDLPNIRGASWRAIYIQEYTRPNEEKCVKAHLGYGSKRGEPISAYDAIILNRKLARLMNLGHFPIVSGDKLFGSGALGSRMMPMEGPLYTVDLFKIWWSNYINEHKLFQNGRIYPNWFMMDAFGTKITASGRQKFVNFFTATPYSITFAQFDAILDQTISELFPDHHKVNIDDDMARRLCAERKRLTGKW